MSRRHASSRRRNYGRRQHEIRERRPGAVDRDWRGPDVDNDWAMRDVEEDRPSAQAPDGYGGAAL